MKKFNSIYTEDYRYPESTSDYFRLPDFKKERKSVELQEALISYPFEDIHKRILELYFEGHSIKYIRKEVGSSAKCFRNNVFRAKNKVLEYYRKTVMAPIPLESRHVNKVIKLAFNNQIKDVYNITDIRSGEIFWVSDKFVRLPDDVQDLLDTDEKYNSWDFINVEFNRR